MNKNLKKIIAIALAFGTVSAVAPAANVNLLTTKAYASTTNTTDTLDSLKLKTSSGSTISLYSANDYVSTNKVDSTSVSKGDTYYAKTSSSTVKLSTSGPSSKYVKVFKGTSSSTKGKSISSDISLSSGSTTTLTVRVYSSAPDSSITYSDDSDVVSEYIINVECTSSSDDTNDTDTLDSLKLETSSGSTIKLYSDNDYASDNKVDSDEVSDGETYYAKSSSSTINISIDGPSNKYVKVFKGTSDSTKCKSITSDISLSSGTTTLTVRVYSSAPDSSVTYSDDSDVVSEYIIKVKCTSSSNDDDADSYDDIYLDKLTVDGESISLSDSDVTYDYDVASDVDEVTIKAVPEDEDSDTVTIDGDEVDDSDSYKNKVSLDKGENKIEIDLQNEDDDEERVYTLTITRASSSSTSTSTTTATDVVTRTVKASQWVQVNGAWQYNDATGTSIKNSWFYDKNYGKNYYLQVDGNMATGWLSYNGKWFYLGTDGAVKTGWQSVSGTWYYLDSQGAMVYNTTIDGYKLGANGAWIK